MKKLFAIIVSAALMLSVIMAMGPVASADGGAVISVESVNAAPGDTVSVKVSISDCDEYSSFTIHISYDSEYVTCESVSKGIKTDLFMPNPSIQGEKTVAIVGGSVNNIKENGVLGTIVFKISDSYPGGVTKVPLKVTKHDITRYNGTSDVAISSASTDGEIVISGASNIVWNDNGTEHDLTPGVLTDEEAKEYKNPLTDEVPAAGDYYINKEEKIAVPATVAEENIISQPDTWKAVTEDKPEPVADDTGNTGDSGEPAEETGKGFVDCLKEHWYCYAGGAVVLAAIIVVVVILIKKKKKAQ